MKKEELPYLYTELVERLHVWLTGLGVTPEQMAWTGLLVGIVLVLAAMVLLSKLLNWLFTMLLHRLSVTTVSELDDNLIKRKTPRYVARIIPLVLAYNLIPAVFVDFLQWAHLAEVLFNIFFILLAVRILRSVLHASKDTLARRAIRYRSKPLDSYMPRCWSLLLWIIAGSPRLLSQLTGRSALDLPHRHGRRIRRAPARSSRIPSSASWQASR
jgi:miniconductance mechanosensitive channel